MGPRVRVVPTPVTRTTGTGHRIRACRIRGISAMGWTVLRRCRTIARPCPIRRVTGIGRSTRIRFQRNLIVRDTRLPTLPAGSRRVSLRQSIGRNTARARMFQDNSINPSRRRRVDLGRQRRLRSIRRRPRTDRRRSSARDQFHRNVIRHHRTILGSNGRTGPKVPDIRPLGTIHGSHIRIRCSAHRPRRIPPAWLGKSASTTALSSPKTAGSPLCVLTPTARTRPTTSGATRMRPVDRSPWSRCG